MTVYYKLTIKGVKGNAFASFYNGVLRQLVNEFEKQEGRDMFICAYLEEHMRLLTHIELTELKPRTVAEKCALFVMMFKEYRNVVYTPTKTQRANLKHVTVTRELLKTYFEAKDYPLGGPKTIDDYIRNYNAVRDLAANGRPVKASFPDVYDRDYEKRISDNPGKLQLYWQHLRDNGWKKVDGTWTPNSLSSKLHED